MLEKLPEFDPTEASIYHCETFVEKINQLIDAVNSIQKEREAERFEIQEWIGILEAVRKSVNVHEKQIDELQMKVEPEKCEIPADRMIGCTTLDIPESYNELHKAAENVQDKFAEQRRWIGKLCWFSNGDGFDEVGYLTEIDPDMPEAKFRCNCHDYYEECKPVKPDDDIIYHGE